MYHTLALPSRLAIIAQFPFCRGLTADWQVDAWCQIEVVKKFQVLSNKGPGPNQRCGIISTQTSIYNVHSATHQSRYLLQDTSPSWSHSTLFLPPVPMTSTSTSEAAIQAAAGAERDRASCGAGPEWVNIFTQNKISSPVCLVLKQGAVTQLFFEVFLMFLACLDHARLAEFHLGILGAQEWKKVQISYPQKRSDFRVGSNWHIFWFLSFRGCQL